MAKFKYDWPALKLEYFQSDFDEVKGFVEAKWMTNDANVRKRTSGRWKEKRARKEKMVQRALDEQARKEAKSLEIPVGTLMKAKKMALTKIIKMMAEQDLDMQDIERGLKNIKTELGEPTNIWSNYNFNKNKDDWALSEEDKEFIEALFSEKTNGKAGNTKRKTK